MIPAYIIIILLITSLILITRHGLPAIPWGSSALVVMMYFYGAALPLGNINRGMMFLALLAGIVIGWHVDLDQYLTRVGWMIIIITALDANGLIPYPPGVTPPTAFWWMRRPILLENPNNVAAWLILLQPGWAGMIALLYTQSRGAILGLAMVNIRKIPISMAGPIVAGSILLLMIAILLRPQTISLRFDLWAGALRTWALSPLVGWGSGAYGNALTYRDGDALMASAVYNMAKGTDTINFTRLYHPHNAIMSLLSENGIIGLITVLNWIWRIGRASQNSQHPARLGLLALLIMQIGDDNWLHPITSPLIGVMIAKTIKRADQARSTDYND